MSKHQQQEEEEEGVPVEFEILPVQKDPQHVAIAGDFSGWKQVDMTKSPTTGMWVKTFDLKPGSKHGYKYIVDGEWVLNNADPRRITTLDGIVNHSLIVPNPTAPAPTAALSVDKEEEEEEEEGKFKHQVAHDAADITDEFATGEDDQSNVIPVVEDTTQDEYSQHMAGGFPKHIPVATTNSTKNDTPNYDNLFKWVLHLLYSNVWSPLGHFFSTLTNRGS